MRLQMAPVNVACIGIGWWSGVLADAMVRSGRFKIVSCFTHSKSKRSDFGRKYYCKMAASYEEVLADRSIEANINTTPNDVHLETTLKAAGAGKHVFLDKPIANTLHDGRAITEACRAAGVVLALGYQRRRENQFRWIKKQIEAGVLGKLVNAEANINRDRGGKIDPSSWRFQAEIGVHYVDVLEYLMGPVKSVTAQTQLVPAGANSDVASMLLEHESGALSTLNASYASASKGYVMNIYGIEATALYDLHGGLRMVRRGVDQSESIHFDVNDTFVDELEEFALAIRGVGVPETGGEYATRSLGVIRAGILSARDGRRVQLAEVLTDPTA